MSEGTVRPSNDVKINPIPAGTGASYQVLVGPDDGADNFILRRFTMEPGGGMPFHTNLVEHEQYILQGECEMVIGETVHRVKAGDAVYVPAKVPHSYKVVSEEPFKFLCIVPNIPDEIEILD